MTKASSLDNKKKAARAANKPRGPGGNGHGAHGDEDSTALVPLAIRVKESQARALEDLSNELLVPKAVLIRVGLDLGIEWARRRAAKLKTGQPDITDQHRAAAK